MAHDPAPCKSRVGVPSNRRFAQHLWQRGLLDQDTLIGVKAEAWHWR